MYSSRLESGMQVKMPQEINKRRYVTKVTGNTSACTPPIGAA
jgi:hypothetical protein